MGTPHHSVLGRFLTAAFSSLSPRPCGALAPGQPRTQSPPANTWGGAGLWAQCGEPGVQKRPECPPFPTLALTLEFSQS